jgi:hypothetical protein
MSREGAVRVAALAVTLWSALASATVMIRLDVPELAKRADAVVVGKVLKMESRWTGDGRQIVTDVHIQVDEPLKGAPAQILIVQQPGGVVGDIGQMVSGLASFKPSEEVVLFLESRGNGKRYLVSGMAQGKYRVERSSDGTTKYAVPDAVGDAMLLDSHSQKPVAGERKTVELSVLKAQIKAAVKAAPATQPKGR